MSLDELSSHDRHIRHVIFSHVVRVGALPTVAELADGFSVTTRELHRRLLRLHDARAIYYDRSRRRLLLANPFSGPTTHFRVHARGLEYHATCGWDLFGIPAALASDAKLVARDAFDKKPLRFEIQGGDVRGDEALVHFPLPFRRWYVDLGFT